MIPFVRDFEFEYGVVQQVSPLIRRLVARNPGPFTYTGTGVYIIGHGTVAVIDPGPALPDHSAALNAALAGETVSHILVTHGHLDHSPLARPLAAATGASVYASVHTPLPALGPDMDEGDDPDFSADVILQDGDTLSGPGWTLRTIATPGHTRGHLCFHLIEENAIFTGDHIMGWSTSVVIPPDGDMRDYLASLDRVAAITPTTLWPTHGPPVTDPAPFIAAYTAHRLQREAEILATLPAAPTIPALVRAIYHAVDPTLHPAAAQSVRAHLDKLIADGRVRQTGDAFSVVS